MQIRIPQRRRVWPLIPPRNFTDERSGNLRLASPPASLDCAARAPVAETRAVILRAPSFDRPFKILELQVDQAFCSRVRMYASSEKICGEFVAAVLFELRRAGRLRLRSFEPLRASQD